MLYVGLFGQAEPLLTNLLIRPAYYADNIVASARSSDFRDRKSELWYILLCVPELLFVHLVNMDMQ